MIFKVLLIIIFILILFGILIILFGENKDNYDCEYLIVLGNKLNNNKPSKILVNRLDKTLQYLDKNKICKIVLSGGVTKSNTISEANVMKDYLIRHNIEENRIILEDKSLDTVENIKNCSSYIDKKSKITLISSSYHLVRSRMICNMVGFKVKTIAAKTPIIDLMKHIPIEVIFIFVNYFRIKKAN